MDLEIKVDSAEFWTSLEQDTAAAKNHKKLIVIDDRLTYIGGINFSEHNFAWHDLMIRFDDRAIAKFFTTDFLDTWSGRERGGAFRFELADFYLFERCFTLGINSHIAIALSPF